MAQAGNKNIDNASGQVVRLDIQNTVKAVATHNFGSRNSAGTILPCEFLADDDTNKLLIRKSTGGDQANPNPSSGTAADFFTVGDLDTENLGLLPKSGGTLTGNLQLPNGTKASPSLNVGVDSGTGLYRSANNTLAFASGGNLKMVLNNTAIQLVGTDTAGAKLRLREKNGEQNHYVQFKCPATLDDHVTLTLPSNLGTPTNDTELNGFRVLKTNSSGVLSFQTVNANDLDGTVLKSTILSSNLESVGTLGSLNVTNTCTAGTFSGSGVSLTNLPAAQLTGTVADARITTLTASKLTGALPAIDGSSLTGITSVVRSFSNNKSLSSTTVSSSDGEVDVVTLTVNALSTSRIVVFFTCEHRHSNSSNNNKSTVRFTSDTGFISGNLEFTEQDAQFVKREATLFDLNESAGNRTFKIKQSANLNSSTVQNASIIAIEYTAT